MANVPLLAVGFIGIFYGLILCFAGYRLFLFLLPVLGFVFGLAFGAQTMQVLFGTSFLSSVTSWTAGLIIGVAFAVSSYLFYMVAVAIVAGSMGYSVAVGALMAIGLPLGALVWLTGIAAAIVLVEATFHLDLQKWVIIVATGILGAESLILSIGVMIYPYADMLANPVQVVLKASPLTVAIGIVAAVLGIVAQIRQNRHYTLERYDHWRSHAVA